MRPLPYCNDGSTASADIGFIVYCNDGSEASADIDYIVNLHYNFQSSGPAQATGLCTLLVAAVDILGIRSLKESQKAAGNCHCCDEGSCNDCDDCIDGDRNYSCETLTGQTAGWFTNKKYCRRAHGSLTRVNINSVFEETRRDRNTNLGVLSVADTMCSRHNVRPVFHMSQHP